MHARALSHHDADPAPIEDILGNVLRAFPVPAHENGGLHDGHPIVLVVGVEKSLCSFVESHGGRGSRPVCIHELRVCADARPCQQDGLQ